MLDARFVSGNVRRDGIKLLQLLPLKQEDWTVINKKMSPKKMLPDSLVLCHRRYRKHRWEDIAVLWSAKIIDKYTTVTSLVWQKHTQSYFTITTFIFSSNFICLTSICLNDQHVLGLHKLQNTFIYNSFFFLLMSYFVLWSDVYADKSRWTLH